MDEYNVREVRAESRELVRLSPELWKLGHGFPDNSRTAINDMEELREEGAEGGVEECRLKGVVVHLDDPYWQHVIVIRSFESKDGRTLELGRPVWFPYPLISIELSDDEVLTGIYETSTSCWDCWCRGWYSDLQVAFRVFNTRTGESVVKGKEFMWTHDQGFILEAPPGFYIAGFHGPEDRLATLGVYLRRLSPEWTSHGPEDQLFGPHLYPPSFVADHDWYLHARRVNECPLSRLTNDIHSIVLSKLLDLHLSSWDPHVQYARLVRPHRSDWGEEPQREQEELLHEDMCIHLEQALEEEQGDDLFWGMATRTMSRKIAHCNKREKRRYRGRRGRTRML